MGLGAPAAVAEGCPVVVPLAAIEDEFGVVELLVGVVLVGDVVGEAVGLEVLLFGGAVDDAVVIGAADSAVTEPSEVLDAASVEAVDAVSVAVAAVSEVGVGAALVGVGRLCPGVV